MGLQVAVVQVFVVENLNFVVQELCFVVQELCFVVQGRVVAAPGMVFANLITALDLRIVLVVQGFVLVVQVQNSVVQ